MKIFKQFKNLFNDSVDNLFSKDNKQARDVTTPEEIKPVRVQTKQVTILKKLNNEMVLSRKLTEGSLKYDKSKKRYTDSKGNKVLPGIFSAKFVEQDEQKKSLFAKIEAPSLSTGMAGLGIVAAIVMFGPMLWPFVKGFLGEVVSGIIKEGIKTLPEPMQKFIGWFTSSDENENPTKASEKILAQAEEVSTTMTELLGQGDQYKEKANEFSEKGSEIVKKGKDLFEKKEDDSDFDQIEKDMGDVEKKQLEDDTKDSKEKKQQPKTEEKPTAASASDQEKKQPPPPKMAEPQQKQADTQPPPVPVTVPEEEKAKPRKRGSLSGARSIQEVEKPKAAASSTPTTNNPSGGASASPPPAVSPATEKQRTAGGVIRDNSVASSMNDAEGNPVEFAANKKITSTFGERVNPVILKETGKTVMQLHPGVDIAGGQGVPIGILSPMKVVATRNTENNSGYGFYLDGLFEKTGMYGRFGHMTRIDVKPGDLVPAGSIIGLMGGKAGTPGAGSSTGPHLHYEYRHKPNFGKKPEDVVDPMGEGISLIAIGKTVMDKSTAVAAQKKEPKEQTNFIGVRTTTTAAPVGKC